MFGRHDGSFWLLFAIIGVAILTDWLDGFLARRWEAVSLLGKLLDPFADAIFCMLVFYDCWSAGLGLVPGWLLGLLIGREMLVTFVLRPTALIKGMVIAAGMTGKYKTAIQFGIIVSYVMLRVPRYAESILLRDLIQGAFYVVLCLSLASAGAYVKKVVSALRNGQSGACGAGAEDQA